MDVPIDYFTERHWNNVAATQAFDSTSCVKALIESIRDSIGDMRRRDILDVGVGNGSLAVAYAAEGARVVGIDLSRRGLKDFHSLLNTCWEGLVAGPTVRLFHMDAQRVGFRSDSFDFITMLKTIWVFPDPAACLRQLSRILRPGGKLIIQCWEAPDDCSLLTTGAKILGERVPSLQLPLGVNGPFDFTPGRIERLLRATGFQDVAFRHYNEAFNVESPGHYWELFRSLADTAYYAFASQSEAERESITAEWLARTGDLRSKNGLQLRLRWMVVDATAADYVRVSAQHECEGTAPALRT
jgi:SAM-dependent methyltransferase